MPPLLAALFELDGVLFDLRAARAAAVRDGLAAQGVLLDGAAAARAATFPGEDDAVRAAVAGAAAAGDSAAVGIDDVALALATHRAERAFTDHLRHGGVSLTDGARAAVDALAARLRLAVVTRLRRADAEWLLAAADVRGAFAMVMAGDDRIGDAAHAGARWAAALARLAPRVPGLLPARAAALVATTTAATEARAAGLRVAFVEPPDRGSGATLSDAHASSPAAVDSALPNADVRLRTLSALTPAGLACALDLAPASCTLPRP